MMATWVKVALVGLGEVGSIFARDLRAAGVEEISAWDTAFGSSDSKASANARSLGIVPAASAADAVADAEFVLSAVTASNCTPAAEAVSAGIRAGAWYLDVNSSSPGHKQAAQRAIEQAGGRYVEAALMSPIEPKRLGSPFILGGAHAESFQNEAAMHSMTECVVGSSDVGRAAATKLCRSVIVKGLEALFAESLLAARTYGVEKEVLDSLPNLLPDGDWERLAGYFVSRSVEHGRRRAQEMEEAAETVREAGVTPWMSLAAVERQNWASQYPDVLPQPGTMALIDALLAASGTKPADAG